VDFELDSAPKVLVISPRDRISLQRDYLPTGDMILDQMQSVETEAGATGVSALVDQTGGVATYPSTVEDSVSYRQAVELAAHEWTHQYLFFHPLGRRYFKDEDTRTINETVANIAGRDIAKLVFERYPDPQTSPRLSTANPAVDFNKEMRELRLTVDDLLSKGRIDEAEARMEQKRQFLADNGYYIRKFNQAYFAFHGTYADTPASSSPIGPKVQQVRDESDSVGEFVRSMASVGSSQELDELLATLSSGG
jgi:hypothetical protein